MKAYLRVIGEGRLLPVAINDRGCEVDWHFDQKIIEIAKQLEAVSRKTVKLAVSSRRSSELCVELSFSMASPKRGLVQDEIDKIVLEGVDELARILSWRASSLIGDRPNVTLKSTPGDDVLREVDRFVVALDKVEGLELTLQGSSMQAVPRVPHERLPARPQKVARSRMFEGQITAVGADLVVINDRVALTRSGHTYKLGDAIETTLRVTEARPLRRYEEADEEPLYVAGKDSA